MQVNAVPDRIWTSQDRPAEWWSGTIPPPRGRTTPKPTFQTPTATEDIDEGDILAQPISIAAGNPVTCLGGRCPERAVSKGMCHPHYKRWRRNGDPGSPTIGVLHARRRPSHCTYPTCSEPHVALGFCSLHYQRVKRSGTPHQPRTPWDGLCRTCSSDGPFYARDTICKACRGERRKAWTQANPERTREFSRRSASRAHARRRADAIATLGGHCACCGESRPAFLAVDHINGGGNAHRRTLTSDGSIVGSLGFYRWLEKAGYPRDQFQLLCHNCNFAKSHGGCPHQTTT